MKCDFCGVGTLSSAAADRRLSETGPTGPEAADAKKRVRTRCPGCLRVSCGVCNYRAAGRLKATGRACPGCGRLLAER